MPQVSAEVRWFWMPCTRLTSRRSTNGSSPEVCHLVGLNKVREDVYVVDPSTDELGVKTREGKSGLEVKALIEPRLLSLGFGARRATAQLWSKVTSSILSLPVKFAGREPRGE